MAQLKLDLTSLKPTAGRVECSFVTPQGTVVKGAIEESFFQDFLSQPTPKLSVIHQQRILADNQTWLVAEAERQLRLGHTSVIIQ